MSRCLTAEKFNTIDLTQPLNLAWEWGEKVWSLINLTLRLILLTFSAISDDVRLESTQMQGWKWQRLKTNSKNTHKINSKEEMPKRKWNENKEDDETMESFIWHLSDPAHRRVRDHFEAPRRSSSFAGDENIRRSLKKHRSSRWCESTINVNENQHTEKGEFEGDRKILQNNENDKIKNEGKNGKKTDFQTRHEAHWILIVLM